MGAFREFDPFLFAFFAGAALVAGVGAAYAPGGTAALGAAVALWVGIQRAPAGTIAALIALLPVLVALNPWQGVDLALSRVVIPFAVAAVVWRARGQLGIHPAPFSYRSRERCGVNRSNILAILFVFLGWAALSSFWASGSAAWALRKTAVWCTLWPLAFAVAAVGGGEGARERCARAIGIAGVGAAAVGLAFWASMASGVLRIAAWRDAVLPIFAGATVAESADQFSSWYVNIGGATIVRALGVFPDPHTLGAVLVLAFPFAVFAWRRAANPRARGRWVAGIAVIASALLLTFSRSAYLGLIAGVVVIAPLELRRLCRRSKGEIAGGSAMPPSAGREASVLTGLAIVRTELRRAVPVAAMALGVALLIFTPVGARLLDAFRSDEGSNAARLALLRTGVAVAFIHPLGVGIGNAPLAAPPRDLPAGTAFTERTPASFHNTYLDLAAELGVVGLALWVSLFGVAIAACWRSARAEPAAAAILASLIGVAMMSLFDIMVYSPVVAPLTAAVLGLAARHKLKAQNSKVKATT